MGRGIAYRWPHFMLFDEDAFQLEYGDEDNPQFEFDESGFRDFQHDVLSAFDGWESSDRHVPYAREAYYFAENNRLKIGIDHSGGGPCIFVTPKTYTHALTGDEKDYVIDRDAKRAFNKLIEEYGPKFFSTATSAWTSAPLAKY